MSDTVATSRLAGDMIKGALEAARERGVMLFIGETEGDRTRRASSAGHARPPGRRDHPGLDVHPAVSCRRLAGAPDVLLNALPKRPARCPRSFPDEVEAGRAGAPACSSRPATATAST